jgi:two-component system alkaline phosphatase synthesis response regulator PhoP
MARRRVLVVEDDPAIRMGVVDALEFGGYEVFEAGSFAEGVRMGTQVELDLVLLDLVLPGGDGLDVLGRVRAARPTLPVIVMTARGAEDDRVRGLQLGADDYVVKPFSVKELLARVQAVLRRSAERPTDLSLVALRDGEADLARQELRFADGGRVDLTEKETAVLRYLAQNAGRVIGRDELLEQVWRLPANGVRTRTVDMTVARLREKLRDPEHIRTVRGRGYEFTSVHP